MKNYSAIALIAGSLFSGCVLAQGLDGHHLTATDARAVALEGKNVRIEPSALV